MAEFIEETITVRLIAAPVKPVQSQDYDPRISYVGVDIGQVDLGDPYWNGAGLNAYTATVMPPGITMDSAGIATGTPSGVAAAHPLITATSTAGSTDANATFAWGVSEVPVITAGDGAGLNLDLKLMI